MAKQRLNKATRNALINRLIGSIKLPDDLVASHAEAFRAVEAAGLHFFRLVSEVTNAAVSETDKAVLKRHGLLQQDRCVYVVPSDGDDSQRYAVDFYDGQVRTPPFNWIIPFFGVGVRQTALRRAAVTPLTNEEMKADKDSKYSDHKGKQRPPEADYVARLWALVPLRPYSPRSCGSGSRPPILATPEIDAAKTAYIEAIEREVALAEEVGVAAERKQEAYRSLVMGARLFEDVTAIAPHAEAWRTEIFGGGSTALVGLTDEAKAAIAEDVAAQEAA